MQLLLMIVSILTVSTLVRTEIENEKSSIIQLNIDHNELPDSYSYQYETSDGTYRSEFGDHKGEGGQNSNTLRVQGETKWVTADGAVYVMTYKAGTHGYRTSIRRLN